MVITAWISQKSYIHISLCVHCLVGFRFCVLTQYNRIPPPPKSAPPHSEHTCSGHTCIKLPLNILRSACHFLCIHDDSAFELYLPLTGSQKLFSQTHEVNHHNTEGACMNAYRNHVHCTSLAIEGSLECRLLANSYCSLVITNGAE